MDSLPFQSQDDETFIEDTPVATDKVSESCYEETNKPAEKVERKDKRKRSKNVEGFEKQSQQREKCWNFFKAVLIEEVKEAEEGEEGEEEVIKRQYGECNVCGKLIKTDPNKNGTSGLNKHYASCALNPDVVAKKNQTNLVFKKENSGEGTVNVWKHDDTRIKQALLDLFVVAELPFKIVENQVFVDYSKALNEKFILPSRRKLSKDIGKYYLEERKKLLTFFCKPTNVVHLTTDTWTSSCQMIKYIVVTAHFIDDDWVMHKRIINFRPIDCGKGDDMGRELLDCIHGWGIKGVITMTVDNASSNDKAVAYLVKKLPNLYENGKRFHVRCMAHILNLIVKDGLSDQNFHVECLRKETRYIRNSTQRIQMFKRCMKELGVESKRFLCGDCPTRWNSTYEMLKIVVDLREVFMSYELKDSSYDRDLDRVPGHVENRFHELFKIYKERFDKVDYNSASQETRVDDVVQCEDGNDFFKEFLNVEECQSVAVETELKRYLHEPRESFTNRFDILRWWKQNAIRFPIVSCMAKDLLAIQISTVASESAFSTGGRVLDPYRTRLSTNIVEALVCTQDWVRKSRKPILDDIDDILNDDSIVIEIEDVIRKQNEKGKGILNEDI